MQQRWVSTGWTGFNQRRIFGNFGSRISVSMWCSPGINYRPLILKYALLTSVLPSFQHVPVSHAAPVSFIEEQAFSMT